MSRPPRRFSERRSRTQHDAPRTITLDGYAASHRAVRELKADGLLPAETKLRSVASAGAVAAFLTNALLYLPLLIALFFWRRLKEPVAAAAGKTGASRHFGRSLHRPLAVHSNCPWADLGYRDCRRFSLGTHADCCA